MNIVLDHLLRTILVYVLLLVTLRIMGKREISQLGVFDLAVILMISDIFVLIIDDLETNMFIFIGCIALLTGLEMLLSFLNLRFPFIRKVADGTTTIIMYEGKLNIKAMRKETLTVDEVLAEARSKGIRTLHEIEVAILETNGRLSFFYKKEKVKGNPLPVIVSGEFVKDSMQFLNLKENQVERKLSKPVKDIYYLSLLDDGSFLEIEYFEEWNNTKTTNNK